MQEESKTPTDLLKPVRIKWDSVAVFAVMHILAVAALFCFSWKGFWAFFIMQWLTGGIGICLAYHRMLTHRSFQLWKPLDYFITWLACFAWQNGPIKWVAVHRMHHARSDMPNDPHSPTRGFFWAHMGWLCSFSDELDRYENYRHYASDLDRDPVYRFIEKTFPYYQLILAAGLFIWGGWSAFLWGFAFRTVFVWHSTWFVNSASHVWGYRTWASNDQSTNNWWVAALTYGEGWHNNHHAFPRSAAHGLRWWELDITHGTIRLFSLLGLAWNIQLPTRQQRQQMAVKAPAALAA